MRIIKSVTKARISGAAMRCFRRRPDLCARVFNIKRKALMDDLRNGEVLGKVVAYLFLIEFQKRGLPHAHILIHFAPEDKPCTPADIDSIISAQLPDPESQPRLCPPP